MFGREDRRDGWEFDYGDWHPLAYSGGSNPFSGQACMYESEGVYTLRSYNTVVFQCEPRTGTSRRCWDGWSVSTARHLRYFLMEVCPSAHPPKKDEWEGMPVLDPIRVGEEGWRKDWEEGK